MLNTRALQVRTIGLPQQKTHSFRVNIRVMMGLLTLAAGATLIGHSAHAQTADAATPPPATVAPPAPASPPPKYSARDVDRVFNYLDTNHDGKISREEAAAFKNIASHFDGADANKDNFLSHAEFDNAVNGRKPQ